MRFLVKSPWHTADLLNPSPFADLINHLVKTTKVNVDSINVSDGSELTALEAAALYDDINMAKMLVR